MADHPYGIIRDGKVYRKPYEDHPELHIGEVLDTEEAALNYYEQRFAHLEQKIAKMEQDVQDKPNKGSYLMKLLHYKDTLHQYEGLGDFPALYERLEKLEEYIRGTITENRKRNLEIKNALLEELKELEEQTNWKEGTEMAKDLKNRWLKTGSLDEEINEEYDEKFHGKIQEFFDRRAAFYEDRQLMFEARVKEYQKLVDEAREIIQQYDERQARYELRNIQQRWRDVGKIPLPMYKPLQYQFNEVTRPLRPQRSYGGGGGYNRDGGGYNRGGGSRPRMGQNRYDNQQGGGYGNRPSYGERQNVQGNSYGNYNQRPRQNYQPMQEGELALDKRRELLQQMRDLEGYSDEAVNEAGNLLQQYKDLGIARSPEVGAITQEIYHTASLKKEHNFLDKLAQGKVNYFDGMDSQEQAKHKADMLRDLLQRDEQQLSIMQQNMARTSGYGPEAKIMKGKLKAQERKVKVKSELLAELERTARG